jgi:VanZ family protein
MRSDAGIAQSEARAVQWDALLMSITWPHEKLDVIHLANTPSHDASGLQAFLFYWLPVVLCVGVMFTMSSLPDPYAVVGHRITISDIVAHIGGFFVLMLLVSRLVAFLRGVAGPRTVLRAAAFCVAYAIVDELHQIPIPGRGCEWIDFFANLGGILAGAVVALVGGMLLSRGRDRG